MDTPRRSLVPVELAPVLAAVVAAALAAGQVALAELCRLLDLGGEFIAGGERTEDVGITLLIWFCALSAPVATLMARSAPTRIRLLSAILAAVGTVAALPVASAFAGSVLADDVSGAVVRGAALGMLAALLTVAVPSAGLGVALHAGVVWAVGLVASVEAAMTAGSLGRTFFAGYVLDGLVNGWSLVDVSGRSFGYFPRNSTVMIVVLLMFAIVAPAIAVARTRRWWKGLAIGFTGPPLAIAAYAADVTRLTMWNQDILPLLGALMVTGWILTGITVTVAGVVTRRKT